MGSITLEVSTDMDGETPMIHKLKGFLHDNRPASGSLHLTVEFQRRSAESEHDEVEFLYCPAGFFTEQEVDDLREAFNLFDTDGGGSISNAEIWTIMQSLGQKPTAEEVQAMVDDFDEDGNGEIDFEEFLGMMYKKALEVSDDVNLADAFKTFDLAGKGFVSEDEMREILLNLDIELTDQEVIIWIVLDCNVCRIDPSAHKGILSVALYARMYTKTVSGVLCAHVAQEYSRSNTAGRRHADDDGKRGGRNDRLQRLRSSDAGVAHGSVLTAMVSCCSQLIAHTVTRGPTICKGVDIAGG